MSSISSYASAFRNVDRSYTRTENGAQIEYQRQLQNGKSVTGQTIITMGEDGSATVNASRTGPNGNSKAVEKTFTADQVESFKDRLSAIGQKLSENPVSLPNGKTADGGFLLKVSA
ncbi:MAG: hypothetical protein ACK5V0_10055 [Alphaproteobacteria bacterium]